MSEQDEPSLAEAIRRQMAASTGKTRPSEPDPPPAGKQTGQLGTRFGLYPEEPESTATKAQTNWPLIRQRSKVIVEQLRKENPDRNMFNDDVIVNIRARLRDMIDRDEAPLSAPDRGVLFQTVLDEFLGFGPLGPLLRDPTVGDIFVNSPTEIYVERNKKLEQVSLSFQDEAHLKETVDKLLIPAGARLDANCPIASARMPNGAQVEATMPPVTPGTTLTIRYFGSTLLTLAQMAEKGSLTPPMVSLVQAYIQNRVNIIVCGGPGSGKTSLVNAFSAFCDPNERLISVEDGKPFRLMQPHWVPLSAIKQRDFVEAAVTMQSLVRAALRMRADRLFVGSLSGNEAYDFLQVLDMRTINGMAAMFAHSPADCLHRLENLVLLAESSLPPAFARELIANTIQVIIHTQRLEDGSRRVVQISELRGLDHGEFVIATIYHLELVDSREGGVMYKHVATGVSPQHAPPAKQ